MKAKWNNKYFRIIAVVLVIAAIGFPTYKWRTAEATSKEAVTMTLVQSSFNAQYASKNPTSVQIGNVPADVYLAAWTNTEGTTQTISACIGGVWVDLRQVPTGKATATPSPTVTPTP